MIYQSKRFAIAFSLGLVLAIFINLGLGSQTSPVMGQSIRPEAVAQKLHQELAFLPLENQYQSHRTGEVDPDNTLMLRFLRYHEYVKSRPLKYRFDWQLTFADYFGVNEPVSAKRYPGHRNLVTNPLDNDREIITKLTRAERNQIIDSLLAIYNPEKASEVKVVEVQETNESDPTLPTRGSAEMLLP